MPAERTKTSIRRSRRISVKIPVIVTGKLADGQPFMEETYVSTVSKHGAKLDTIFPLEPGMTVHLRPRAGKVGGAFRVVWVSWPRGSRVAHVGVECFAVSPLLGIDFPE